MFDHAQDGHRGHARARHEREERKRVGPTPRTETEPPKQLVPERKLGFRQNLPPFYFLFCCHPPTAAWSWAGQGQQRGPSSLKHADLCLNGSIPRNSVNAPAPLHIRLSGVNESCTRTIGTGSSSMHPLQSVCVRVARCCVQALPITVYKTLSS
jgi:hypothetical protein